MHTYTDTQQDNGKAVVLTLRQQALPPTIENSLGSTSPDSWLS